MSKPPAPSTYDDATAAIEAERRRLAQLLEERIVDPLNLLLAQASAYEQTLDANPQAKMTASVLGSLARRALQQVWDLAATLHPTTLEWLGLEPALEALANQTMRMHGLQVTLRMERLPDRLPPQIELVLFRAAQDALDHAITHAHASAATITLYRQGVDLIFTFADNGLSQSAGEPLHLAGQRIEQFGGKAHINTQSGLEFTARFTLEAPIQFTPREIDVLQLVAEGLKDKEIAAQLVLSPRTVNFHLDNIYSKLGVNSRTEAAIYALRHGITRNPR